LQNDTAFFMNPSRLHFILIFTYKKSALYKNADFLITLPANAVILKKSN